MQAIEVFKPQIFTSQADGAEEGVYTVPLPAALNAKTVILYLWIYSVDTNTRVQVNWDHSADGVNAYHEDTALVDTGAGSDAAVGMYIGDNGSTEFGAYVTFSVDVTERTSPNSLVKCTASLWAVFKPF